MGRDARAELVDFLDKKAFEPVLRARPEMFRDDLTSEPAKKIDRELRELGLPTLHDVRGEFERLAEQVGVRG